MTNSAGSVAERYAYDAYGNTLVLSPAGTPRSTSALGNPFTYTGRYNHAEIGLMYFRARYYDPGMGEFISRDPLEYVDGMSLYRGYFVPGAVDPLGLVTLGAATRSLQRKGVRGQCTSSISHGGQIHEEIPVYCDSQIFNEWIALELANTAWLSNIPDCPDKICVVDGVPNQCDNGQWNSLGEASQTFHPGAKWCMRSKEFSGSAQQCCYDESGDLMTALPAAETPDRYAAGFFNGVYLLHYWHDVQTYNLAVRLGRLADYGRVRPPSRGGGTCYEN